MPTPVCLCVTACFRCYEDYSGTRCETNTIDDFLSRTNRKILVYIHNVPKLARPVNTSSKIVTIVTVCEELNDDDDDDYVVNRFLLKKLQQIGQRFVLNEMVFRFPPHLNAVLRLLYFANS